MLCSSNLRTLFSLFFFFKQKTAYEMRISDWSSDVCSSDLKARRFYILVQQLQRSRKRNGARSCSVARDIRDPWIWRERYVCATWLDFLRQRDRPTVKEAQIHQEVAALHEGPGPIQIGRASCR